MPNREVLRMERRATDSAAARAHHLDQHDAVLADVRIETVTQSLADIVRTADPATLQRYAAGLDDDDLAMLEQTIADLKDPDGRRVYRQLGYEPICIPRVKVALALGYANPIEAEDAGAVLPAMCGECPSERFETAAEFDLLFGGTAGASKTLTVLMFVIRCMARWPGFRALFLRETFDQLDENVYPELRKIDNAAAIGGHWNAGRRQLDIGESVCRFRYMADADDALQRRGGSYQLIVLDERNLLPVGTGDRLRDRLRSADPNIPVIGFRSTANPGGASHGELKSKFVRPDPRMVETTVNRYGDTCTTVRQGSTSFARRFIPAKPTDNPYLGQEYFDDILGGIEDPVLRKAMQDGDWDVFQGQYFAEWSHARHVVPRDAVTLDRGWPRYEGIDYGRAAPFCMLRAAIDGDGRAWLYREIYEAGLDEAVQAKMIRDDEEAMGDRGAFRAGDPSMWGKIGASLTFAETYRREGVTMVQAKHDRVPGWARVHSYLAETEPCGYHAGLGWETCPKLHVLEGTCPNLVRTLPDMIFDKHKVEDAWSDGDDHAPDSCRYLLMHPRLTRGPARISVPGAQHVR